ncbi:MAG: hypothetical protein R2911_45805 [Caldilineaceae bacterium]
MIALLGVGVVLVAPGRLCAAARLNTRQRCSSNSLMAAASVATSAAVNIL